MPLATAFAAMLKTRTILLAGILLAATLLAGCDAPQSHMSALTARATLGFRHSAFQDAFNQRLDTLGLDERLKLTSMDVKYNDNGTQREFTYHLSENPDIIVWGNSTGNKSDDLEDITVFVSIPAQETSLALEDAITIYTTALKLINPNMSDAIVSEILSGLSLNETLPTREFWKEYSRRGSAAAYTLRVSTDFGKADRAIMLGIRRAEDLDTLQVVDLGLTLD